MGLFDAFKSSDTKNELKTREERRLKAMQNIVHALQVPLSRVAPDELNCASGVDFRNEDWLIEQLERVPEIIMQMSNEHRIPQNRELKREIEDYSEYTYEDFLKDEYYKNRREIERLKDENEKLRQKQQEMAREGYEPHLPEYGSNETWYDLKAQIMEKDREIETLKEILEFSEKDKQEWADHNELFHHMIKIKLFYVKQNREFEDEIEALKAELSTRVQTINVIFRDERRDEKTEVGNQ